VTDTAAEKKALREHLRQTVEAMTSTERDAASLRACARVLASPLLQTAATILVYAPLPAEIDTGTLIQALRGLGRRICLPRADWAAKTLEAVAVDGPIAALSAGRHGVRQPGPEAPIVEASRIDAIIVPGIGFDRRGNRLGRGAGFYDRFLARARAARPGVVIFGVCFDQQLVDTVPHDARDAPVDAVATPGELVVIGPPSVGEDSQAGARGVCSPRAETQND
jgi:5-formyltetrahydrofolate cyclo-ligase